MFLNIEDKLYIFIEYNSFEYFIKFLNISIEDVYKFFDLYKKDKNKISYLSKRVNKD